MARNWFAATGAWIPINGMSATFAFKRTPMRFKVPDKFAPLQAGSKM